jgi:arylsulfatase A-like enzyme
MKKIYVLIPVLFIAFTLEQKINAQSSQPNIVFIMVDDLGYGDVGCYGSEYNLTPYIDSLATGGLRLTDYHSNGATCSPTRVALLTGQYQYRYGKRFEIPLNASNKDPDNGLSPEAYTIAEALRDNGYATGMYGKWHLGYKFPFLPSEQGFGDFVGLRSGDGDHFTHINRWGVKDWWHNDTLKMEKGYSVDLITDHSIDFIKKNKENPFFLYVSHLAIHFPWQAPNDPAQRIEGTDYTNDKWGFIPDRKNVRPHVKGMIEAVDASVGKIIKTLKELNLEKNTLVILTSDNGGYIEYESGGFENISSNGPLRGQKGNVYEGGHRVPFIAYWPGKIKGGEVSNETVMTMDMYPSFLKLAKINSVDSKALDGKNVLPILLENKEMPQRTVYWKTTNNRAIRHGNWKLVMPAQQEVELYNLSNDIGEREDVSSKNLSIVKKMKRLYSKWEKDVTKNYCKYERPN